MVEIDAEIERALARLDLETKVRLLSGQDMWSLPDIPAIGLASLVTCDGPIGVRGTAWRPDDPSVALPSPTALAATWDPVLARTAGRVLGRECRRRGVHVLLAPTVNLHRSPLGGRHFECYSEDPLLTAEIGAGYVRGVQDQGVAACVKHYVANDFETERMTAEVRADERTLRELYLVPFERIVAAGVWSVMAAYNGVNGHTMTEHGPLVNGVLKGEWGFDGAVISDWTAARSTAPAALGGLDVVMPALGDPWGRPLVEAVRAGKVPEEVVDDKVRRVLRLAARTGAWTPLSPASRPVVDAPDRAEVAHEVAVRSFVLARNEASALPLDAGSLRRVAVLGALAADARVQGGGSAHVHAERVVSPLAGLTAALPGVRVDHAVGADPRPRLPTAEAGGQWGDGFTAVLRDAEGGELFRTRLDAAVVRWMGGLPDGLDLDALAAVELSGTLTALAGGTHRLAINGSGVFRLEVAGRALFDGVALPDGADPAMVFLQPEDTRVDVDLAAGEAVPVTLTQRIMVPELASFVNLTLGHAPPYPDPDAQLADAVELAASADVAVVVVGTTEEVESEGFDRTSLALPGRQDELVTRVAAANPRTIVVVNAGSPVLMPWAGEVAAILLTWFPGQEAGAALADVLLGVTEPGGRLPTTWPRRAQDCPVLDTAPRDGVVRYDEGVFIGYRAWARAGTEPLFPFGHGLGYTTWAYESLAVTDPGAAQVTVRNTGARRGREVVQVYVDGALAGFAGVAADPGEAVTVRVPLSPRAMQTWDDGWRTRPGPYLVEAGRSATDRPLATTCRAPAG
jgi:beta-glucosidase